MPTKIVPCLSTAPRSHRNLLSWSPANPSKQVVPRSFDGERRFEQNPFRNWGHFANSLLEPALGGLVRQAHREIVGRKLAANIGGENLAPRCAPDSLRECIII